MSAKHSPAPWAIEPPSEDGGFVYSGDIIVCDQPQSAWQQSSRAWESNAPLIAAAPDLLGALKTVSNAWARCEETADFDCADGINCIDWDAIRAAIAKAEGRS